MVDATMCRQATTTGRTMANTSAVNRSTLTGRPLFDDHDVPIERALLELRSFEHGVTMHRYAVRDAREASSC